MSTMTSISSPEVDSLASSIDARIPTPISLLPNHVLSTIFSFLSYDTTICVLNRVCKQWSNACNSPLAFAGQCLYLSNTRKVAGLAHWVPYFQKLYLAQNILTTPCLLMLTPHMSETLRLETDVSYSDMPPLDMFVTPEFISFSQSCRKLTHLRLDYVAYSPQQEHTFLSCVCPLFPHVRHLRMINAGGIPIKNPAPPSHDDWSWLRHFSTNTLNHLIIESSTSVSHLSDHMLQGIAASCSSITDLSVVHLYPDALFEPQLTHAGITALSSGFPHLSAIHLHHCTIPPPLLRSLLTRCTSLTHIHVSHQCCQPELNDILAQHSNITQLTVDISQLIGETPPFSSPHIRTIVLHCTLSRPSDVCEALCKYLACNPAVIDIAVRTDDFCQPPRDGLVDIIRRYPTVRRIYWRCKSWPSYL